MRILVTFAVDAEFAPWRKLRPFRVVERSFLRVHSCRIRDAELNVLLTGVGGRSSWLNAAKVLWNNDVDLCVSSGLAGALRREYAIGDVLVARQVHSAESSRDVSADPQLVTIAVNAGAREVRRFYSAGRVVLSAQEKRDLGRTSDAVEMESGNILHEAAAFGARSVAIRGISDLAEEDLPIDFNRTVKADGEVSVTSVLAEVAKNPAAMPRLIRFGRQSAFAAERLCAFLERYIQQVLALSTDDRKTVVQ